MIPCFTKPSSVELLRPARHPTEPFQDGRADWPRATIPAWRSKAPHVCVTRTGHDRLGFLRRVSGIASRAHPPAMLRKVLNPLSAVEAMELLLDKLGKTKSNADFLSAMQKVS